MIITSWNCINLMRKLLSSPVKMPLSEIENQIYQNALKHISAITLNLLAVKVNYRPEDFVSWCQELTRICQQDLNLDLLDTPQLPVLKKLQETLASGISITQLKMLRISPWPIFHSFIVNNAQVQALDERIKLLDYINNLTEKSLQDMIPEDRLAFAGKHTNQHDISVYNFDVEWFAGTKGAKTFHQLLSNHPEAFDQALNAIPKSGEVTEQDYRNFVQHYQEIFSRFTDNEKAPLMAATRLLAMRRPDQFIALSNNKIDVFCQGFAITKLNNRDFDRYWHDCIGTLRTMPWWCHPQPESPEESKLWQARAILIDLFLFADDNLAANSNYIKLRDKPTKTSATTVNKRSKESAENLVDRALASDDLPDYLKAKRDSIVIEVKNGKSVTHVIDMMRAIFG